MTRADYLRRRRQALAEVKRLGRIRNPDALPLSEVAALVALKRRLETAAVPER